MNLADYTTEELKAELKRRADFKKLEKKNEKRCRNCVHMIKHPNFDKMWLCSARTWGKYDRPYCIKPHFKACDKYKQKETD